MTLALDMDVIDGTVTLMTVLLLFALASVECSDFMDQFDQYYPTLFHRDHRQYLFGNIDHRHHFYCDCSHLGWLQSVNSNDSQLQARVDVVAQGEDLLSQQPRALNNTELSVIPPNKHFDELTKLSAYDDHILLSAPSTSSASSFITQQQLLAVVMPCILLFLFVVFAIFFIVVSVIKRQRRQETCSRHHHRPSINNNFDGSVTVSQLHRSCQPSQNNHQHQQLYDSLSLGVLKMVPRSSDKVDPKPSCSDRFKLNDIKADLQPAYDQQNQWNAQFPARKQVTLQCYLDTSAVHTVLMPKSTTPKNCHHST